MTFKLLDTMIPISALIIIFGNTRHDAITVGLCIVALGICGISFLRETR